MHFQRVQPNIVRSIRHVSLIKDWTRARRTETLPHFSDFVPDERSGESADLMIAEARDDGEETRFYCRSAGARVDQIFDRPMSGCYFLDVVDSHVAVAAKPMWHGCISHGLPIYLMVPVKDRDGCPVTIEKVYLPYRLAGHKPEIVVASMHAWSTEGRFAIQGLLRSLDTAPLHWAVIVDPALAAPMPVHAVDSPDQIEVS